MCPKDVLAPREHPLSQRWSVLGMSEGCPMGVLRMSYGCPRVGRGVAWRCPWRVLEIPRGALAVLRGVLRGVSCPKDQLGMS